MGVYIRTGTPGPEPRTPGANTVAYFPFKDDILDHSGNGISLTNTQYFSKDTIGYNRSHSQGQSGSYIAVGFTNSNVNFISLWYKTNTNPSGVTVAGGLDKCSTQYYQSHNQRFLSNKFITFTDSSYNYVSSEGLSFNERHNITIGYDGTDIKISKDGTQTTLYNGSGYNLGNTVYLCGVGSDGNQNITLGEVICETDCWTAQEIANYYNQTKGNYGL